LFGELLLQPLLLLPPLLLLLLLPYLLPRPLLLLPRPLRAVRDWLIRTVLLYPLLLL
jgi:hypothetical protein